MASRTQRRSPVSMLIKLTASFAVALAAVWTVLSPSSAPSLVSAPAPPSQEQLWPGSNAWASMVLDTLTLEEKIGQLFVSGAAATAEGLSSPEWEALLMRVEQGEVGGVVFSTGDAARQAEAIRTLQTRSPLPLLITQDMETGAGMRLTGATKFPPAMALGATRSTELAYLQGKAIAAEARAIGVHQSYAPVADVNVNPANPVINVRSFGATATTVGALTAAMVRGLQDGGVIATVKHFPGHGDTAADTHTQLATITADRQRLDAVELVPFRQAVQSGVMSVMTGHLAVPALDPGSQAPATLSPRIISGVLRDELGFNGLVVTDGLKMQAVRQAGSPSEIAIRALEAGSDQLLLSADEPGTAAAIAEAVRSGRLSERRIDASVMRILRAKAWVGLDDVVEEPPLIEDPVADAQLSTPEVRRATRAAHVAAPQPELLQRSEALGRHIARNAVTVLREDERLLPLVGPDAPRRVLTLILDDGLDPLTGQPLVEAIAAHTPEQGGTFSLRLSLGDPDAFYVSALERVREADVVVLASFRRARSGQGNVALPPRHLAFSQEVMAQRRPVMLALFGTPYVGQSLPGAAAFIAAYGDGPAEQEAVADALFGQIPLRGRLPVPIPGVGGTGEGLQLAQQAPRLGTTLDAGLRDDARQRVDAVMRQAVADRVFPGAAVAIGRAGVVTQLQGYGSLSYGGSAVTPDTPYDLASVTKVVGTTLAMMQLVEQNRVDLDAPVRTYVPSFRPLGGERITVRQLLSHTAGQRPWFPFYARGILDRQDVFRFIHSDTLRYRPGSRSVYSDFDMIVLGEVIEAVTGQTYERHVTESILEPLGLAATSPDLPDDLSSHAVGYPRWLPG
ncbi:MAG: glycoside hydrolase family 3 N-terminal domain-containing protein, partial [Bacteroidota bacterium]